MQAGWIVAGCVAGLLAGAAAAQDRVQRDAEGDRFVAGGSLSITQPVQADLLAAGGEVQIDTSIGGDLIVVGGNLRVQGEVGQGALIGGGQVLIDGRVKRNVRAGGGRVTIGPRGQLGGNLSVAGGQVRIEGPVFGYVQVAGGDVTIDGPVGGDVWMTGGRLALGPKARIAGRLRYASRRDLDRDPAAVVQGGVEPVSFESGWPREHGEARRDTMSGWLWTVGLMVLAAVLVGAAPAFTARASAALRGRPWWSLLLGFIVLVCVPVAALLLLVTVIGLPLALVALLAYPALLLVGYVLTAVGLGDWVLWRFAADRAQSAGMRALAAAVAMFCVGLATRIPWVGGALLFLALLAGVGALAQQWRRPAASS
jgi:cytoskeletal protein CcmA (bactofilin family)